MTRTEFFKQNLIKFATAILLLGLIVYTVYQAVNSSPTSLLTTPARRATDVHYFSGKSAAFREEVVLTADTAGLVSQAVSNGSKVGKNATLAEVYAPRTGTTLSDDQALLEDLDRLIAVLEEGIPEESAGLSKLSEWKKEANEIYLSICRSLTDGNYSSLSEMTDRMLILLNRRDALIYGDGALTDALSSAQAARAELLTGAPISSVGSDAPGYWFNRRYTDGFERVCTREFLSTATPEDFSLLVTTAVPFSLGANTVGKEVCDYAWDLAVGLTLADADNFTVGKAYAVTFPELDGYTVSMSLTEVRRSDASALLIFRSEEMNQTVASLRFQTAEIAVVGETGFSVPEEAIVTENGTSFVYVLNGSIVEVRSVRILFRGDGYCIVAEGAEAGSLSVNDLIIVSGKNLYEGKVYQ